MSGEGIRERGRGRPSQRWSRILALGEALVQILAMLAFLLSHGSRQFETLLTGESGGLAMAALTYLTVSGALRYYWSIDRAEFWVDHRVSLGLSATWLVGLVLAALLELGESLWSHRAFALGTSVQAWSEAVLVLRILAELVRLIRKVALRGWNPALVLVGSFGVLIFLGTALLMLPVSRAPVDVESMRGGFSGTPWLVALFTATSASCVTGLVMVDTATYWSRTGQVIILSLIQMGGLGIMTFGAFFALASRQGMPMRESVFLTNLLEAEHIHSVRRLVLSILVFTVSAELIGAVLLTGLWPDLPWRERMFFSTFHAVSAFCNAGFSLSTDNLVGAGDRWQVWGVVTLLIITGGLGFAVLQNMSSVLLAQIRHRLRLGKVQPIAPQVRLTLTSRLVLATTAALLVGGTVLVYFLEDGAVLRGMPFGERVANAWFTSVTFRTAGFNTIDIGSLHPATKLLGIGLMFIGASPGSTGGGVKTVCFAMTMIATLSLLRGRDRVEVAHRTIPDGNIKRGATIIALALLLVMTCTFVIALFEDQPALFLDHLFEATSAFGTVGLSANLTHRLTPPSQLALVVMMFVGRVGPLTLLAALAGRVTVQNFEYPNERVMLG